MRLQDYLKQNRISPGAFAEKAGIYPSVLYRMISGERGISYDAALKIVAAADGHVGFDEILPDGKAQ